MAQRRSSVGVNHERRETAWSELLKHLDLKILREVSGHQKASKALKGDVGSCVHST